ncbi:transposase [Catellatospora tritici]|uniref:transposase n=1 Tax=Catellatospora tritici TaxID=2851566 RepID=UPI001C2DBB55|nr:transposase [Catellatospora tritici]
MFVVVRRQELSDVEWAALEPFLPPVVSGGRPRSDDRRVLNAVTWKIRSGVSVAGPAGTVRGVGEWSCWSSSVACPVWARRA